MKQLRDIYREVKSFPFLVKYNDLLFGGHGTYLIVGRSGEAWVTDAGTLFTGINKQWDLLDWFEKSATLHNLSDRATERDHSQAFSWQEPAKCSVCKPYYVTCRCSNE